MATRADGSELTDEVEDGGVNAAETVHPDEVPPLAKFPVVCVGASAGGLTAFGQFLAAIPEDTGMAFVLVQHLDPQHESQLTHLLAKETRLPVVEAVEGQVIQPNHVYVTPPSVDMALAQGALRMTPRPVGPGLHLSIDFFMRTLARECGSRGIGVVLSGTGSDGTFGLSEIKAAGGITFAQELSSAGSTEMPASVIAHGHADFILTPAEIARELAVISRHPYVSGPVTATDGELFPHDELDYATVIAALKQASRIDFSLYRTSTIKRRLLRRMTLRGLGSLAPYAAGLKDDAVEVAALLKDVLINVTSFFRDQEVFEAVKNLVFPQITKEGAETPIRIWVVACSTGQEAYSLAIELIEHFAAGPLNRPIQIFATDISDDSLTRARAGVYPTSIEGEMSAERLRRHFSQVEGGYRINKSIRDLCIFARHDITADTPFSKIDVITCRNVLIYLTPVLQAQVITTFCYTLVPNGFLVLGSAETVGRSTDLFEAIDAKHRVFMKKSGACRVRPPTLAAKRPAAVVSPVVSIKAPTVSDLQRAADRIVLGRYAPAGVLVDGDLNILQFRGKSADFLDPAQGQASLNLLKMVPQGLAVELARAIAEAKQQHITIYRRGIRLRTETRLREINVEVSLVSLPGAIEPAILVLFDEPALAAQPNQRPQDEPTFLAQLAEAPPDARDYALLKQELASAADYQLSLIEENTAINDELRSANDEAVSSNEEQRCSNEELQTAKEEVESANEELATLNEELRNRNVELTNLTDDLTNLLGSINLPVVMLDGDLRIRRLSGPTVKILDLGPEDIGHQLRMLPQGWVGSGLQEAVTEVMRTHVLKEVEVQNDRERWFLMRVSPYRTESGEVTGTVATYIDIDDVKRSQEFLRRSRDTAKAIIETGHSPQLVLDASLRVHTANRAFCRFFALTQEEILGQPIYQLSEGGWNIPQVRELLDGILCGGGPREYVELTHEFPRLGRRVLIINACSLEGTDPDETKIVLAIDDVTEEKRISDELKSTAVELQRSNAELGQFAYVASHDMQEPLRMVTMYASILKERYDSQLDERGQHLLKQVTEGAGRTQQLIRDILSYAHIDQPIEFSQVDCNEVVSHVLEGLVGLIKDAQADITVDQLPQVHGNPVQLGRVFQNLIANSIKFRVPGTVPHVTVSAVRQGRQWWFTVADDGIGIAPAHHEKIFRVFQRLHSRAEYEGSGIGLAVCRKIVHRHGGEIQIESSGSRGTRIRFSLAATA